MAKVDLNDAAAVKALDTLKMLDLTMDYPAQFRLGRKLGKEADLPKSPSRVDEVVILGTGGGSAAAGYFLKSYLFNKCATPIEIIQGYNCPGYVDANTLVIAVSHSGNTEEGLSAFRQAKEKGATLMAIGAGGKLKAAAAEFGAPYMDFPGGFMPRIAIGYIFTPILTFLERWGLISDCSAELEETITLFEQLAKEFGPESPVEKNRAKQLAQSLGQFIPVIYGFADHFDSVAWRIKRQLGENSKYMGFWNTIPHLHHDEAVGWDMQPELLKQLGFLFVRDQAGESQKIGKRWQATKEILQERAGVVEEIEARGTGLMARMFSMIMLGDFFTIYMAIQKGVDPTPVAIIDLFKAKVGQ